MELVHLIRMHLKKPCREFWNGIRVHVLDAFSMHCGTDGVLPLLRSFTVTECKEISRVGNKM
jgi:hypothetical protein